MAAKSELATANLLLSGIDRTSVVAYKALQRRIVRICHLTSHHLAIG